MAKRPPQQRSSYQIGGEEVREESGWRYPLLILMATLLLMAILSAIYFGPGVEELAGDAPRPSTAEESVLVDIGGLTFDVPANHTKFPRDRRPGERDQLTLYAAWPRMDGFTPSRRVDFVENRPNSRRIDILIETNNTPFDEGERLDILYLPHVTEAGGVPDEHGLTRYQFASGSSLKPGSGYADRTMYIGETESGEQAVLFCYNENADTLIPPECFRYYDLNEDVWVRYIFKLPYLQEWRRIDAEVQAFVKRLEISG